MKFIRMSGNYTEKDYQDAIAAYRDAYQAANGRVCPIIGRAGQFIFVDGTGTGATVRMKKLRELTANLLARRPAATGGEPR
jgi:hypothetical protein